MHRLVFLPVILFMGCGGGSAKEYRNSEGQYRVVFPGTPQQDEQKLDKTMHRIATVQQRQGMYAVLYADAAVPPESEAEMRNRLDQARERLLAKDKLDLAKESPVELDKKYPGREINAVVPGKGKSRTRIYLVNQRVYQVTAAGTDKFMDSPETSQFFDSFQLIK